jgi:hypothetical protein
VRGGCDPAGVLGLLALVGGMKAERRKLTKANKDGLSGLPDKAVGDVFRRFSTTSHSVWGRLVPDIPAFCRELVAAPAKG